MSNVIIIMNNQENRDAEKIAKDKYERLSYMNRERESSYDRSLIQAGRRVGNTTRLADRAIQIIFSGKVCIVSDHYFGDMDMVESRRQAHIRASRYLFDIILKRLRREYSYLNIVANKQNLEIYLKQEYLDDIRDKK